MNGTAVYRKLVVMALFWLSVLGTLVAIFLLATGVKGLQLVGTPSYVDSLFNGLALIVAVALAARTTRRKA